MKLKFLTIAGCSNCAKAKIVLEKIKKDYNNLKIEEINIASSKGQKMAAKYQIMASPGIIIDDELFQVGGLDEKQLRKKLEDIKN